MLTLFVCLICLPAFARDPDQVRRSQELRRQGQYKQAEETLRTALAGPLEQDARIAVMLDLGDILREQDRRAESRQLFSEALNFPNITWEQKFASTLGLADVDRQEQNWLKSVQENTAAADLARAHNDELLAAFADRGLGEAWLEQGNLARAKPLLRRALTVLDSDPHVPKERVALALDSLASLYRLQDKMALAEETWFKELNIHRRVLGEYHPQTAMVMGRLAELWSKEGQFDKACSWALKSLDVMKNHFGDRSLAAGTALITAGLVEERARHLESAAGMYSDALGIFREVSPDPQSLRIVAQLYAKILSQMHKGREAKQVMSSFAAK